MLRPLSILAIVACLAACGRSAPSPAATTPAPTPPALPPPTPVAAIAQAARPAPAVLFIGLDGADWQNLDQFIAKGVMPNLAALVREGTSGVLETNRPPLSPLLWTTMMTGKSPLEHGILDFAQFNAQTGAKEPISSSLRRVPAVWNMLNAGGKTAAVFGLWATYPAEPVNGVIVSDRLFNFLFSHSTASRGVVYPADREAWARDALARAESAADFPALKTYLPWLTEPEFRQHLNETDPYAHPISALRRILIETRVYDEIGRAAWERDHPALAVIYVEGTDSIGHVFAPYAPPRQPSISETDFARYAQVPETYFRMIDAQIGTYRSLVQQAKGVLMLASDHGFLWGEGRPESLSSNANSTAAKWHRSAGMYLLWGSGIAAGGHAQKGHIRQVTPTLLALTGLPPAQGLTDAPLQGAPAIGMPAPVDYQASYRPMPAPPPEPASASGDSDALAKLKSLGYISDIGTKGRAGEVRTPGSYNNEGVILREQGKLTEAAAAFEKAIEADPALASALWNLSDLLFPNAAEADRSDSLLVRAYANGLPEGTKFLIGRAIGYQRARQTDRSVKLVTGALEAKPSERDLWLFRGRYRVELGDCRAAVIDFQRAESLAPADPAGYVSEGLAQACAGDVAAARKALGRALELDPNQPKIRGLLRSLENTR